MTSARVARLLMEFDKVGMESAVSVKENSWAQRCVSVPNRVSARRYENTLKIYRLLFRLC